MALASFEHGRRAEAAAAAFLEYKQCTVRTRNWRTRWCEIDIVATRETTVYFCEVKYRQNMAQGTGVDYITTKKLRQMHFAAEFWLAKNSWQGDCQLCVIEVSGPEYRVTAALTDVR
jgi:uncharacterized protein (TIGR00252 family)